ncbi:MAG: serine/threonine-protein kinase [Pseudomonadota bacterium]
MNCTNCGTLLPDDADFCPECGVKRGMDFSAMQTIGDLKTVYDFNETKSSDGDVEVLAPGSKFADRYIIEGILGMGGMGVVYKAEDEVSGEAVALKLIRPERLSSDKALKKLIEEGVTTRKLRHENIVAVYDVGVAEGQPYVSMEHVEGDSLRTWQREMWQTHGDIPFRVSARIVAEILDGLKAAHAAGVIHRDLKPENIILLRDPDEKAAPLRILDFGIAAVKGGATQTGTGTGIGTREYMSPEQKTNPDSVTPATDLYSLSVIFYELIVKVVPQGHWQPPSGGRSDVPSGIDRLIEQGLSNRQESRPQSAPEYRQRLVDAVNLRDYSPPPPPPSPPHPPYKPVNPDQQTGLPKWAIWAGAGGGGFVLLMIIIAALVDSGTYPEDGPCDHLFGAAYEECVFGSGTNTSSNALENLSGFWVDQWGGEASVSVNRNGQFSGSGFGVDGTPFNIKGQLSRSTTIGRIDVPTFGVWYNIELRWDGGCRIDYTTRNPDGSVLMSGTFHANHAPGERCP